MRQDRPGPGAGGRRGSPARLPRRVLWVDGSRQPKKEAKRLCLALGLERAPGERWVECWQRWAGASERRCLLIIDDATPGPTLTSFVAGLGSQVVVLVTTQLGIEIRAAVARWLPAETVMAIVVGGLRLPQAASWLS